MHDPFAMRPFFGYNFGDYLKHWLKLGADPKHKTPKIFHVNWFRTDDDDKFLWPGFCENVRVLDWIMKRIEDQDVAQDCAIGRIPKEGTLNLDGLGEINTKELFKLTPEFLNSECEELEKYFKEQVNKDLPDEMWEELRKLKERSNSM